MALDLGRATRQLLSVLPVLRPVSRRGCRTSRPIGPSGGTTPVALSQVVELLADAALDILAFAPFPVSHWRKLWSNNPQKRLN